MFWSNIYNDSFSIICQGEFTSYIFISLLHLFFCWVLMSSLAQWVSTESVLSQYCTALMIQVGTRLCGLRPLLSCYWVKTAETVTMIFRHLLCGLLFSTQRQQQLWSIMGCTATDHVDGLFYYTASIGVKFRLKLQRKCVWECVCVWLSSVFSEIVVKLT